SGADRAPSSMTAFGDLSRHHVLSSWLFLRLLGLIYLTAFLSLRGQVAGLIGDRGLLPAADLCRFPARSRRLMLLIFPTLCWWSTSDRFLRGLCGAGAALSLVLVVGVAPIPVLAALWLLYVSLMNASGEFLSFQWDALLVESGVLAILVAPPEILPAFPPRAQPSPIGVGLIVWLLFRLLLSSGIVKLRSRGPTSRKLSALP